jgi:hypothetical protein
MTPNAAAKSPGLIMWYPDIGISDEITSTASAKEDQSDSELCYQFG